LLEKGKELLLFFFPLPPFLDSRPAPPASPAPSPLPLLLISGRGPARAAVPARLSLPLAPCVGPATAPAQLRTSPALQQLPPRLPSPRSAADTRPRPSARSPTSVPRPSRTEPTPQPRPLHARRGSAPSPRPGLFLSEAEPPRVPLSLPAPFFAVAHTSEAATAEERWDPPCASRRPRAISDLIFPVVRIPLLPSLSPTFYLGIWWLVWPFRVRPGSSCSPAMATAASNLSSGRLLGMAEVA